MSEEKNEPKEALSEEEIRRRIIEEEQQKQILANFERVNHRTFSAEELKKLTEINREIDECKKKQKEWEKEHEEKQVLYQNRIKAENVKPVLVPIYFLLAFFAAIDILCILVFRHIFDQTPFLKYAWVFCFVVMIIMGIGQTIYLRHSKNIRLPLHERIVELQGLIKENTEKIKELEAERDAI